MLNFLNDINYNRKMSIDDICEFHCRFEKIHPFLDGNGRIGRLIMLRQCILNNVGLFIVSNETRNEYINSLKLYHQTGFSSFLTSYCKKLQVFFKEKYESKYQVDSIDREAWVINFIKQNGYIKRVDIEKHFKIKITSANNLIKNLIKSKLIISKNKGRLTVYILNISRN
jgi:Fic family protein